MALAPSDRLSQLKIIWYHAIPQDNAKDATDNPLPTSNSTEMTPSDCAETRTGQGQDSEAMKLIAYKAAFTSATTTAHTMVSGFVIRNDPPSVIKSIEAGTKAGTKAGIAVAAIGKWRRRFLRCWPRVHRDGRSTCNNRGSTAKLEAELVAYHASSAAAMSFARGVFQVDTHVWEVGGEGVAKTIEKSVAVGVAAGIAAAAVARCLRRCSWNR
ncbi:hypothetical protein QBC34DRAFT_411901 [Podospora aff. communis PSN243]|uniref:Uncharacterized protein n=1 Tax=Podospora aff. communis PSN243 TaxID=3040156 RepID=A0AAV9GG36_9PEZI|nr:hypothetical protein QBC34DRAFT_411901 [Podospora aff. communis PSN243]